MGDDYTEDMGVYAAVFAVVTLLVAAIALFERIAG